MREQLSGSHIAGSQHKHPQMPPAAQDRLLRSVRTELDMLVKSRFPPAAAAGQAEGQPPWLLAPLVQACSAYAACAAVIAAGAVEAAAVQAWSHAELSSGSPLCFMTLSLSWLPLRRFADLSVVFCEPQAFWRRLCIMLRCRGLRLCRAKQRFRMLACWQSWAWHLDHMLSTTRSATSRGEIAGLVAACAACSCFNMPTVTTYHNAPADPWSTC